MTTFQTLIFDESRDHVEVTLNKPATKNAIDAEMIDERHRVCATLERDPRIMLLTGGSDGVFAGGADIAQLRDRRRDDALAGINVNLFERIRALPMPTVAAIDGYALGGGAELSYACDIRVATPRTVFGQPEPGLGIIAGAGATFRLVRLLGESVAKQVLLSGEWLDAERALHTGLVQSVVDPTDLLDSARAIVAKMGRSSHLALRMTKLAVDSGEAAHPQIELAIQALLFEDEEKIARMTAFLDRRATNAGSAR